MIRLVSIIVLYLLLISEQTADYIWQFAIDIFKHEYSDWRFMNISNFQSL